MSDFPGFLALFKLFLTPKFIQNRGPNRYISPCYSLKKHLFLSQNFLYIPLHPKKWCFLQYAPSRGSKITFSLDVLTWAVFGGVGHVGIGCVCPVSNMVGTMLGT